MKDPPIKSLIHPALSPSSGFCSCARLRGSFCFFRFLFFCHLTFFLSKKMKLICVRSDITHHIQCHDDDDYCCFAKKISDDKTAEVQGCVKMCVCVICIFLCICICSLQVVFMFQSRHWGSTGRPIWSTFMGWMRTATTSHWHWSSRLSSSTASLFPPTVWRTGEPYRYSSLQGCVRKDIRVTSSVFFRYSLFVFVIIIHINAGYYLSSVAFQLSYCSSLCWRQVRDGLLLKSIDWRWGFHIQKVTPYTHNKARRSPHYLSENKHWVS